MSHVLISVTQKLNDAAKTCSWMNEPMRQFVNYLSAIANDELLPQGMLVCFACACDDLHNGHCGFGRIDFPAYLIEHQSEVLAELPYFPQVIDEIADPSFAKEFRILCKEALRYDPPYRHNVTASNKHPEYARVAAKWWYDQITHPKKDNGDPSLTNMLALLSNIGSTSGKNLSKEEAELFQDRLADIIVRDVNNYGRCILGVDYHACNELMEAADGLNLDSMMDFPFKTNMLIDPREVRVSCGLAAPYEVLYTA